jgi:hypothetical protein
VSSPQSVSPQRVSEECLRIMPVVVGTGQRLFEDIDTSRVHLKLADVRKLEGGSAILTYLPSFFPPNSS